MSVKKSKFRNDIYVALKAIRYFIPLAWRIKKKYFIFMTINLISDMLHPFVDLILIPLIMDELLNEKRLELLIIYVIVLVVGDALLGRISVYSSSVANVYDTLFDNYINTMLTKRTMEMDFALTENKEALDQMEKAKEGISWYSGGIQGLIRPFLDLVREIFILCGVVILIVMHAPVMLLVTVFFVFLHALINRRFMKIEIQNFKDLSKLNRSFGYTLFELLEFKYAKDIRLYGAFGMMMEKTNHEIKQLVRIWKRQAGQNLPWSLLDSLLSCINSGIMYIYLGVLTLLSKISIGIFAQMVASVSRFSSSINSIIYSVQRLIQSSSYINEYIKFMEYPAVLHKGDKKPEITQHTIEFRNVSFAYPNTDVKVLNDVSITIRPGEHLSIVGLNGAGKTTFIKLLCRLYDVDSGEILLDGVNIKEYDYEEYMKLLSVVFQDFRLLSFSIRDNITLNKEATESELLDICRLVGIDDKISSLEKGLETVIFKSFDKDGIELSGGEQQKLAIARALYKNSPIVILDEPTAALDPIAEYDIYRQFDKLVGGKTAIYISHRLSSCRFCDKIAVFFDGSLKEYGHHDELVTYKNGIYAEMFQAQAQYYR